jgi:hypothetical protein
MTWESLRRMKYAEIISGNHMVLLLNGDKGKVAIKGITKLLDGGGLAFYQNFSYSLCP